MNFHIFSAYYSEFQEKIRNYPNTPNELGRKFGIIRIDLGNKFGIPN